MRLFAPASASLTAAAALLAAAAAPAPAPAAVEPRAAPPACAAADDDHAFPLTTRIHGGPDGYEPGGAPGTWYLDLTNTTSRACEGVHPVLVLVDDRHDLAPAQPRLEFDDEGRTYPVRFEHTDRDELVAPFGEEPATTAPGDAATAPGDAAPAPGDAAPAPGDATPAAPFGGFTVGPGETLTVTVRLAFAAQTAPNEVTATAAVVQRRGDDGEWVGQSDDYRFRIGSGEGGTGQGAGPVAPSVASTPDGRRGAFPFADELAGTGRGRLNAALAVTALLLAAGGTALLLTRRRH
ncbi:hypothetical protein [Streptomyces tagetis]|uniref:Gram-positive cocci surface proteins LPxTG domain-containing protein n=1 Tax=Streptomyces tagetis TaxID=2820809 RepID=A0A941AZQ4_9ACTN|nr:hypothetical protein [Streptomyces sp. RG38]MBQ0829074.1 hypothetical protein [Streptomyces sp. RG38]